jgi:hypothetical protein
MHGAAFITQKPKDNAMTTRSHHDNVEKQFGSQASAYLTSAVHASGRDLQRLAERLADFPRPTCWIWDAVPDTPALRRHRLPR